MTVQTTHEPTEDVPYGIDEFAIADEKPDTSEPNDLSPHDSLVKELRAYLKKAIADHNSFDVLYIPQNAKPEDKIAVFDEMFNHKGLVHHLRQIESIIDNKVKEN